MMKIVAGALKIRFWQLFPFKQMLTTLLCCTIAAVISYFAVVILPLPELRLLNLIIGFSLFAINVLILGYWMKIDFMSVVRPITAKLFKRI